MTLCVSRLSNQQATALSIHCTWNERLLPKLTGVPQPRVVSALRKTPLTSLPRNLLAASEANQSVLEQVDPEGIVAGDIHVDPQVKLPPANEVGFVQVPARGSKHQERATASANVLGTFKMYSGPQMVWFREHKQLEIFTQTISLFTPPQKFMIFRKRAYCFTREADKPTQHFPACQTAVFLPSREPSQKAGTNQDEILHFSAQGEILRILSYFKTTLWPTSNTHGGSYCPVLTWARTNLGKFPTPPSVLMSTG